MVERALAGFHLHGGPQALKDVRHTVSNPRVHTEESACGADPIVKCCGHA